MCEQLCENKKLVITKFSIFLQTQNSNFRLSANRALNLETVHSRKYVCVRRLRGGLTTKFEPSRYLS